MNQNQYTRSLILAAILIVVTLALVMSLLWMASQGDPTQMHDLLRRLPDALSFHSLLVGGCIIAALGIVLAGSFMGLALHIVKTLTRPKRQDHFIPLTPFALDLPAEEVAFSPAQGDHLVRGLYMAHQGATTSVIVSPGYRRSLSDVLGICKHVWAAGHNVLAFEYYGHGSVVGVPITLGYREIDDFLGAVSYVRERAPEARIGALGYSMGGAVTIMGSAQTPDVLAVVADSAFASQWSAVEMAVRRTFRLSPDTFTGALSILRWITDIVLGWRAGYHFDQVEPSRDIARLAPRPVLLIHGLSDTVVHPDDSMRLYEAASEPKDLWHLPNTKHIKGYFTDSVTYTSKVLDFFDRALKESALTVQDVRAHQEEAVATTLAEQVCRTASAEREDLTSPARVRQLASSALGLAYGHLVYRFRWPIVVLWLILLLGSLPLAGNVQTVLHNSGYSITGSQSQTVTTLLTAKLHQPATQLFAVFQSATTPVRDTAYQHELHDFIARAQSFAHVSSVTEAGVGTDGRSTLVVIGFDQDKDDVAQYLPAFRHHVSSVPLHPAQLSLTGDAAAADETQVDTESDTKKAELLAMPLTLLTLVLVFGSVVAGLMPLLLAAVAVPGSLAIIYLLALHIPTNIFIQSVASIIGLGLSIDYSLFLIRRFREELAQGSPVPVALAQTIATAGEAILFSATTVAIGFAGLLFLGVQIMTSFGIGGITVASVTALAAMTLLPALLGILGHRINAIALPRLHLRRRFRPSRAGNEQVPTFWHAWALFVMKRPALMLLFITVVLLGLGWPALSLTPGLPGASSLPADSEARHGSDILTHQFPTINQDPMTLLVQTADGSPILSTHNVQRIATLTRELMRFPQVIAVTSLTQVPAPPGTHPPEGPQLLRLYSTGGYQQLPTLRQFVARIAADDTTTITLRTSTLAGSHEDAQLIDRLRALGPQGLIVRVGGARALNLDFNRVLYGNFFRALIFLVLATYVLLLFTFRSVLLPLKAILMNVLSISAAYGALVFIFQQGHFETLLGFTATGFIDRFIPILLFCVLFGLSMDYEVFLLSRMREEWLHTGSNRQAVARGLEKTGGVITSAAFLFIIVSGSFIFTQLIVTKELGLGITVAVFVDATLIRSVLVPASMQLMGTWNWWFPWRPRAVDDSNEKMSSAISPLGSVSPAQRTIQQGVVEQSLIRIFAHILSLPAEQVKASSDFFQLGGDADTLDELLAAIEQHYQVQLTSGDIFDHPILFRLALVISVQRTDIHESVAVFA